MFPENLTFDENQQQTIQMNEAIRLIFQIDEELQSIKKGQTR